MAVDVPGGILKQSDVRETITNTEETSVSFNTVFARFEEQKVMGTGMTGFFVNAEGTELYTTDAGDDVKQWTMATKWTISSATLTHTLDLNARNDDLRGVSFKPDGTKMYVGGGNTDHIYEFDLSTPWLLSSAVYLQELDITGSETQLEGFYMREDGKRLYTSGTSGVDRIMEWQLSTAWDITTGVKIDEIAVTANPKGITFNKDGDFVYFPTSATDIQIWKLTSVFRISTASASTTFVGTPLPGPVDIKFNPNGRKMFLMNPTKVGEFTIKRGWR